MWVLLQDPYNSYVGANHPKILGGLKNQTKFSGNKAMEGFAPHTSGVSRFLSCGEEAVWFYPVAPHLKIEALS